MINNLQLLTKQWNFVPKPKSQQVTQGHMPCLGPGAAGDLEVVLGQLKVNKTQ